MKRIKKVLFLALLLVLPVSALAVSDPVNDQIAALQAQINQLIKQIELLKSQSVEVSTTAKKIQTNEHTVHAIPVQYESVKPITTDEEVIVSQYCYDIKRTLFRSHSDTDSVIQLQKFLMSRDESSWPSSVGATGYYGTITENAVKNFQRHHGLASYGGPETTGYGLVGPSTRAKIKSLSCGYTKPYIPVADYVKLDQKSKMKSGETYRIYGTRNGIELAGIAMPGCPLPEPGTDYYCDPRPSFSFKFTGEHGVKYASAYLKDKTKVGSYDYYLTVLDQSYTSVGNYVTILLESDRTTQPQEDPVIHGVSGPVKLEVGEQGKWTVKASHPNDKALSYSVSWGDQISSASQVMAANDSMKQFVQTSTFTHSYHDTGIYTVSFTVKDENGGYAHSSMTVKVVRDDPDAPVIKSVHPDSIEVYSKVTLLGENFIDYSINTFAPQTVTVYIDGIAVDTVIPVSGQELSFQMPEYIEKPVACIMIYPAPPCNPIKEPLAGSYHEIHVTNQYGRSNSMKVFVYQITTHGTDATTADSGR